MKYAAYAVIGIILIYYISKGMNKKKENPSYVADAKTPGDINKPGTMGLQKQIIESLKSIADEYGIDIARKVEQLFRLETRHFGSGQFLATFSPGMEKHSDKYPFGWKSMKAYWDEIGLVPTFHTMPENKTGLSKTFLKFPNVLTAMRSVARYIKNYSPERWYSLDPVKQAEYRDSLNSIKPKIVNTFANA